MKIKCFIFVFIAFISFNLFSQESNFSKGEKLFIENHPEECIPYFEKAILNGENSKAYTYLSVAYFQIKKFNESVKVCEKGMNDFASDKKILAYNAGNSCYALGLFEEAEKWYSIAISADSLFFEPILNRANAKLKSGKIDECILDYEKYVNMVPDDVQKDNIILLIKILKDYKVELAEQERIRLEEEEKIKAENERIQRELMEQELKRKAELEKQLAEEAEKRRKLLEDVASSLQNNEAENMSAGAEGTFDYEYETELE